MEQEGITVSSTYIRTLVAQGEIERANEFLGTPTPSATGCPTEEAGLHPGLSHREPPAEGKRPLPAKGVYATKVILENGRPTPL
ncbi:MAG: hypothetical protein ACLSF6_07495 [Evtepia gabavorous]